MSGNHFSVDSRYITSSYAALSSPGLSVARPDAAKNLRRFQGRPLPPASWRQRHGPLLAQWVYNDLLREITLELCFEVHRKLGTQSGHLINPEALSNRSQGIYAPFQSKKPNPADSLISCDNCDKRIHVSKYAPHLEKCLGLGGRNRNKRKTSSADYDLAATIAESRRYALAQQLPQQPPLQQQPGMVGNPNSHHLNPHPPVQAGGGIHHPNPQMPNGSG